MQFLLSINPVSYTHSDAADEEDSVDLGGRRIIKKKNKKNKNKQQQLLRHTSQNTTLIF